MESQGKDSRQGYGGRNYVEATEGSCLLFDSVSCSVCFLILPKTMVQQWHHLQWAAPSLTNYQSRKCAIDLSTGNLMGAFSHLKLFFPDNSSLCDPNQDSVLASVPLKSHPSNLNSFNTVGYSHNDKLGEILLPSEVGFEERLLFKPCRGHKQELCREQEIFQREGIIDAET